MQSSFPERVLKILAWITGVFLFLLMATLTRVDMSDYHHNTFYEETISEIRSSDFTPSTGETWLVGWDKVNATPAQPASLVGYKPRGKYEFIEDSSFVRSLVIGNGNSRIAILNYELMIVHPYLYGHIKQAVQLAGLPIDYLYFTATHTHSGIGGYMPGIVGKLSFGGFDDTIIQLLTDATLSSLKTALENMESTEITFQRVSADTLVANRLFPEDPVDPIIRMLRFKSKSGKKASFITFNGHPTILASNFMGLSGDYPHYLTALLEAEEDFAMFAAGTVGSHRPVSGGNQPEHVRAYAQAVYQHVISAGSEGENVLPHSMTLDNVPMHLRKPHLRISDRIRIRPWIFNSLIGDVNNHLDRVQLGNFLLIGSSAELSGVFMTEFEKFANSKGMNLMLTCFNGGYIGYVTPDAYYDLPLYEARDMNWFGPQNEAYFNEIIKLLIAPQ
jgi:hypothetical protein